MQFTDKKIIISGSTVEVFLYDGDVHAYDFSIPRGCIKFEEIPEGETEDQKAYRLERENEKKIKSRKTSMFRAKSHLIRLVNCNIWQWFKDDGRRYIPIFLTLSFKENFINIKEANYIFSKFIKRLNYEITGEKKGFLKYVGVIEFQERGAIHFHLVFFNLKFIWADTMGIIWGEGFIKIKKIGRVKSIGAYITKYMSKNFLDARLDGKKRYFSSRGLYKPEVFLNQTWVSQIYDVLPKKYIIKESNYWSMYGGCQTKALVYKLPYKMDVENIIKRIYD